MKKLTETQLSVLIDLYDGRSVQGKTRTINSLINRGLIDRDWELTELGLEVIEEIDIENETNEIIESSFYLGTQVVDNPEKIIIAGLGMILGAFLKKRR